MQWSKKKDRVKIRLLFQKYVFIALFLPLLGLCGILFISNVIAVDQQLERSTQMAINQIKNDTDIYLELHQKLLSLFSQEPKVIQALNTPLEMAPSLALINKFNAQLDQNANLALGLSNGQMFSNNVNKLPKDYDPRRRPWYIKTLLAKTEFWISEPYKSALDSKLYSVTLSKKVFDDTGKVIGVAGIDLDISHFLNRHYNELDQASLAVLIYGSNGILIGKSPNATDQDLKAINFESLKRNAKSGTTRVGNRIIHTGHHSQTGWWIVTLSQNSVLVSAKYTVLVLCLVLFMAIMIVEFGLYRRMRRTVINPMDEVIQHIEKVNFDNSEKDQSIIPYNDHDVSELNRLKVAYNNMRDRIVSQKDQLEHNQMEISRQYMEIEALYEETIAMNDTLNETVESLHESWKQTVLVLSNAIEANDKYTRGHCDRVRTYAIQLAEHLGLSQTQIGHLEFAAMLHDIGKVGVPYHILNKEGHLDHQERDEIQKHPRTGYNIIQGVKFLEPVAEIIYNHHESPDGSGYPSGKKLEAIQIEARILSVADAYDAMTTARSYRKTPLSRLDALAELQKHAGKQFDHTVVKAACDVFQEDVLE